MHRVQRDRERLGERRALERHVRRHRQDAGGAAGVPHEDVGREPALGAAVSDVVAGGHRVHDDGRPRRDAAHRRSDARDDARDLVAERHRRAGAGEPARRDVAEVTAAEAARRDADDDVVGSARGLRYLVETDVAGRVNGRDSHGRCSLS